MATEMKFESWSKLNPQNWTLWEFHDFSVSQILREISFGESRISRKQISAFKKSENS